MSQGRSLLNFDGHQQPPEMYSFFNNKTLLPDEKLQDKARNELNEVPEERESEIEALRQIIKEEANLRANTDEAFLLRFLRSRKYNRERALKLIRSYYRSKFDYPSIYKTLVPSDVAEVFESNLFTILPGLDKQGRAVGIMRFKNWDVTKVTSDQLLRAIILSAEGLLEQECFQICGAVSIVDLSGFQFQHLRQITPAFVYRAFSFLQDWSPIRFQGFFFVKENALFDFAFAIMSKFMRAKLRKRIHFLGDDLEKLQDFFSPEILPVSLGGFHDSEDDDCKNWLRYLLTQEEHFKTNNLLYGYK